MAEDKEVAVDEQEMHPNDPEVRDLREKAIEYADRVAAGEEPWKELDVEGEATDEAAAPKNDDVEESGDFDSEPVPVPDDIANAPALDADDPVVTDSDH